MEIFTAPRSGETVFFSNLFSPAGEAIVFDPKQRRFLPLNDDVRGCSNREQINCNWVAEPHGLCASCAATETVPDLAKDGNLALWAEAEAAKRWVMANLMRWGYFLSADTKPLPAFRFLSEETAQGPAEVVMGHANNVVTITVQEASPVIREQRREKLAERFRTMVGHLRHEISHALFLRFSKDSSFLADFRALFGDETADYSDALERYYGNGPTPHWQSQFLTPYASAHPHEDWAETCAHALHLIDMLDSACHGSLTARTIDPYMRTDHDALLKEAARLGVSLNHVNRSMGMSDLYPFVFSDVTQQKLRFAITALQKHAPSNAH